MKVCGIEMGDVAVIVGVDDDALWRATEGVEGKSYTAPSASFGVGTGFVQVARVAGLTLIARNLGDSLHPSKHAPMVAALRAAGVPVVATTHSPDVVDCFTGDEVVVLHEGKAARLSQHPEWASQSTRMRAGAFWSTAGEAWVGDLTTEDGQ
jgi:hypothetical protein